MIELFIGICIGCIGCVLIFGMLLENKDRRISYLESDLKSSNDDLKEAQFELKQMKNALDTSIRIIPDVRVDAYNIRKIKGTVQIQSNMQPLISQNEICNRLFDSMRDELMGYMDIYSYSNPRDMTTVFEAQINVCERG